MPANREQVLDECIATMNEVQRELDTAGGKLCREKFSRAVCNPRQHGAVLTEIDSIIAMLQRAKTKLEPVQGKWRKVY